MSNDISSLNTKTVTVGKYSVTVAESTVLIGMKRFSLMQAAKSVEEPDLDRRFLRQVVFPNLASCLVAADGIDLPLTFDAFCNLPETLWNEWQDAVRSCNPQWYPKAEEETGPKATESQPEPPTPTESTAV